MDRAWQDAREHGWSRKPVVEVLIPSTLDDTLCPPGQHVASLFCQHVAPELPDGKSWDDHREEVADLMIATVDSYAPGFAASVDRPADPVAARSRAPVRTARRRYLPRRADAEPAVLGPPDARPRRLSRAPQGPLPLRLRRPSRRRRHRRPRPQRRARDPAGSPGAVRVNEEAVQPALNLDGILSGGCSGRVALAASSIKENTSTGIDASDAWPAFSVMIFLAPILSAILFSFSGAIIRSSLEI